MKLAGVPWECLIFFLIVRAPGELVMAQSVGSILFHAGGSTFPLDVYKVWKPVYQAYRSKYVRVEFTYQGIGSGEGLARLKSGEFDVAGSDAELYNVTYDAFPDFQMFPTMAGSVSLAYNIPELSYNCSNASQELSSCLSLSQEALVGIFNGTIIYWNDPLIVINNEVLRDVNKRITVVVRADGSGTTQIFSGALSLFDPKWKATYAKFSDGCKANEQPIKWNTTLSLRCGSAGRGVAAIVMENKYSIAYLGTSDARDSNLMEARLQNRDGIFTYPTLKSVESAINASSDFGTRLTSDLNNLPGYATYPIAGFTYFVIRKTTMRNCTIAVELYRMVDFLLSDPLAQTVAKDLIKVPLGDKVLKQVRQYALHQMMCQGSSVKEMAEYAESVETGARDAWKLPTAIVIVVVVATLLIILSMWGYSKYQKHKSALTNSFIIAANHIEAHMKPIGSITSNKTRQSGPSSIIVDWVSGFDGEIIQQVVGDNLLLTPLCTHLNPVDMNWQAKVMLVRFRDEISQGNLVKLIGISERKERWNVVSICPAKGRLTDVIRTTKFNLDNIFRNSIINDIAQAMAYLHSKSIVHGQLTTHCCYIDARWNVVIGDWEEYSLHKAQKADFYAFERTHNAISDEQNQEIDLYDYCRLLFWTAPEALVFVAGVFVASGMQKAADVYSYGIVVYETFAGCEPYEPVLKALSEDTYKSPQMLLKQIRAEHLRPAYYNELVMKFDQTGALIWSTWDTNPSNRPTFSEILKQMKLANPKQKSILDTMMVAVERYATNLEEKVMERTRDLEKTTKSLESLLNNMLPAALAAKLANGEAVEPEYFDGSTVFFSDVVGFTTFASAHTPFQVVKLLNDLYSSFDSVIMKYIDVYKVETIGDAYMCVSGVPERNGNNHSAAIADMALGILHTVVTVKISDVLSEQLRVRIGVNSGPVIAGVVGLKMPRYCLFGDTVNTASRMESSSLPLRIQVSEATKILLDEFHIYNLVERGLRNVKGKGTMTTYWLISSEQFDGVLPKFDAADDEQLFSLLDKDQVK